MSTTVKLGSYALGLVIAFAAAWGAGRLAAPVAPVAAHAEASGAAEAGGHGDSHTAQPSTGTTAAAPLPGGLQVAQDGYRLVPLTNELSTLGAVPFAFRVLGPDGAAVTGYTTAHDKDLHLIVVRRDLSGFQHVHPVLGAEGVWSVPLRVEQPGQYRVFADFQPIGRDKGLILGVDVPAPGDYRPAAMPAPARTATIDGYTVTLDGDLVPGTASRLTLTASLGGAPVTDLQPYLAAYGHLVALRDGDLAYLHVHPDGTPGDGRTQAGPQIVFYAEVPSTGVYGLFLDFQHAGTVRTAAFTATAGGTR